MSNPSLASFLLAATLLVAGCGDDGSSTGTGGKGGTGGTGGSGASGGSGGTGGTGGAGASGGSGGSTTTTTSSEPMCGARTTSSTLTGVRIEFPEQPCSFTLAEAAAGITIAYDILVEQDVSGVVPAPQDAGACGQPGPSGLIPFHEIEGGDQKYCLCDVGFCMGPSDRPVTLQQGTYPETLPWDGKSWFGPSDTNNPKGPPFPPGDYEVRVSATGEWQSSEGKKPFLVEATLGITLVP